MKSEISFRGAVKLYARRNLSNSYRSSVVSTSSVCDLCMKEIKLENRSTTHFSRDGRMNLMKNFNERTGRTYNRT
ncbi:hypothetical protein M5K25_009389 [Dendrobium thyrsiflorum]|uniref:Uncharacterized protein n=1 Tax=Dendrobium thyrsiflorum TaxID=117978 RepID=A0ABD0V5N9_DENTH